MDAFKMPQGLYFAVRKMTEVSNIGVPGVLLFQVDREKISYDDTCASPGTVLSFI